MTLLRIVGGDVQVPQWHSGSPEHQWRTVKGAAAVRALAYLVGELQSEIAALKARLEAKP